MAVAVTDAPEATEDESQFRIEATGALREPRTRILKHGETFGVLNQFGDMVGDPGSPDGLYHQDTRFLSQLELRLNGDRPLLLSSNPAEDGSVLPVDLANTDTIAADGSELHRELIYLNRRQFIWRSAYYELLQIRNFDLRRHQVTLSVRFGADFADVFEVRGLKRARRGKRSVERLSADTVVLGYAGLDGIDRTTTLHFSPVPAQLDRSSAEFVLDLGPGQGCRLALRAGCGDRGSEDWTVGRCYRALRDARRALRASSARAAAIEGSNAVFNELARLGEVPFGRYYGTVDATPLFVMLVGEYFARTGDLALIRALWPNVMAALNWIDTRGDPDRDGFVEYHRRSISGLDNQGWKDSADAIFHADGSLAQGPIAMCEVQGYVFAAKRHAADLARALGESVTAARLDSEAETLRRNFEAAFWCEELSIYALALDGEKRPCHVIASNAGHALLTGIAAPERAARVAATLMRVGSFSGWGVRTMALTAARYNPISYHNGSVWPHDNALIALGLTRYGHKEAALRVFT